MNPQPAMSDWQALDLEDPAAGARWDAFCRERAEAPAFAQAAAWGRAIRRAYGAECRSLYRETAAGWQLLPLYRVWTLAGRPRLVSVPYASYGGALPRDAVSATDMPVLPGPVRIRAVERTPADPAALTPAARVTLWLELPGAAETLWNAFPAKVRNQVRKAEREGVTVEAGREAKVGEFLALYNRRMHELGTPAHTPAFFEALLAEFAEAEILVAYHAGEAISAIFDVGWGPWRVNLYGAGLFAKRSLCANNLVYWRSLERGIGSGKTRYDFGRSRFASGQYEFKRQWGAVPYAVREFRLVPERAGWREEAVAEGQALGLLAWIWRRLPRPLVNGLNRRGLRRYVY